MWPLEAGIAATLALRNYWISAYQHPDFVVVRGFDHGLYATIYHDLFLILAETPGLERTVEEIRALIPTRLPNYLDADMMSDDEIADQEDAFIRAVGILERVGVEMGWNLSNPDASHATELFTMFGGEIEWFRVSGLRQCEQVLAHRLPADNPSPKSKAGRKPAALDYGTAQRAFWRVSDALESEGESRRPSQQDVIDNLTESGNAVSKTTFGRFVKEWKLTGKAWPPPRPDTDD